MHTYITVANSCTVLVGDAQYWESRVCIVLDQLPHRDAHVRLGSLRLTARRSSRSGRRAPMQAESIAAAGAELRAFGRKRVAKDEKA